MAMYLTKVTNTEKKEATFSSNNPQFKEVIPHVDLKIGKEYLLSIAIDLSIPKNRPSDSFLDNLEVSLNFVRTKRSPIFLELDDYKVQRDNTGLCYFLEVKFVVEKPSSYELSEKEFLDMFNLDSLCISFSPKHKSIKRTFTYNVEFISEKLSDEKSNKAKLFTFEPGIIRDESLPFSKEEIMKSKEKEFLKMTEKEEKQYIQKDRRISDGKMSSFTADSLNNINGLPSGSVNLPFRPQPATEEKTEAVNNPAHYNDSGIETFEMFLLANSDRPQKIMGALEFNIAKYRDRYKLKGKETEDQQKMLWYLDKYTLLFPDESKLYTLYHASKNFK